MGPCFVGVQVVLLWVYMDSEFVAHTRGPQDLLWICGGSWGSSFGLKFFDAFLEAA